MVGTAQSDKACSLSAARIRAFCTLIYKHYETDGRHDLPWRNTADAYQIIVSEVMLQQTQVNRAIAKYHEFITRFPDMRSLAQASLCDVLTVWQGLGYNRRGAALRSLAQTIISEHGGVIPDDPETLRQLSGLGKYSAAAIAAFAFNSPQVFIETNIRTVFIHHFFKDRQSVDDGELLPYIEKTLDRRDPRKWYYALMDYGVVLKKTLGNAASRSSHYKRQSAFKGSNRQLRGKMLKLLLASPKGLTAASIAKTLEADEAAIRANLMRFAAEELIKRSGRCYCIAQD